MNWSEFWNDVVVQGIWMDDVNRHQITVATVTASTGMSVAGLIDMIQGPLSVCGIAAGLVATLILARANWKLGEQRELEIQLLKRRVQGLADDPNVEKRHDA